MTLRTICPKTKETRYTIHPDYENDENDEKKRYLPPMTKLEWMILLESLDYVAERFEYDSLIEVLRETPFEELKEAD